MDNISENLSRESKSPMVHIERSRKHRKKLDMENNQQSRKQRRRLTKPRSSQNFSERTYLDSAGFRYNTVIDNPYCNPCSVCYPATAGYLPYEGSNYFAYAIPRSKIPRHRNFRGVLKANEFYETENDQGSKRSSDTNAMRVIQDDMKDLKEKLSAVVENLTKVVEALVKTTGKQDGIDEKSGQDPSTANVLNLKTTEKSVQFSANNIKSRSRGRSGFCCLGTRSVESMETDSDYYRPEQSHNSKSKLQRNNDQKSFESSLFDYGETSSPGSRKSRSCHHVTVCYLFQQLLYRAKLLFF